MKTLFVSNLFPDQSRPIWGLDNAVVLHHLAKRLETRVLATRFDPFYSRSKRHLLARPEDLELKPEFLGIPYVPKIGHRFNHRLYLKRLLPTLQRIHQTFPFERLLASWLYPDGWAVGQAAKRLDLPFALIAQGSDVHQYLNAPHRRSAIIQTVNRSLGVITRSADLTFRLRNAGAHANKCHVIYNGIDTELFHPGDSTEARKQLSLPENEWLILFVGNLLPIKRPELLVSAFARLKNQAPDRAVRLVMIGDGPLRSKLSRQLSDLGIPPESVLLGRKPPQEIARYMRAAQCLTLASLNEGVPNVILESLASGLPVVAPQVGGIPEVVTESHHGSIGPIEQPEDLVQLWRQQGQKKTDPAGLARHAEQFSWPQTALGYEQLLRNELKAS